MKNIFKIIFVLIFLFSAGWVNAQSNTIDYRLESETVKTSGLDVTIFSTIHKVGNTLEWKQEAKGNVSSTNFQITDISGNWNQNKSKGSLSYVIATEGYQGLFTLEKTNDGLIASLFLKQEDEEQRFTFPINTITYL